MGKENRNLAETWEDFKQAMEEISKKQKTSKPHSHSIEFKSFSSKKGTFSLTVNCRECKEKFIEEFKIGSCPKCQKIFNDKVENKIEELKKKNEHQPEWTLRLTAMLEVTNPNWRDMMHKLKDENKGKRKKFK